MARQSVMMYTVLALALALAPVSNVERFYFLLGKLSTKRMIYLLARTQAISCEEQAEKGEIYEEMEGREGCGQYTS